MDEKEIHRKKLFQVLREMEYAAEHGDEKRVNDLNRNVFSQEYEKVFPDAHRALSGSDAQADLYDMARNNLLNVFMDYFKDKPKKRIEMLETAKKYIAKIPRPEKK